MRATKKTSTAISDFHSNLLLVRAKISGLKAEIKTLSATSTTPLEAEIRVKSVVQALADECRAGLMVESFLVRDEEYFADRVMAQATRLGVSTVVMGGVVPEIVTSPSPTTAAHFLSYLFPEKMSAAIMADIKEAMKSSAVRVLSEDDVVCERNRLEAELLSVSVSEEALIREAEACGMTVYRRADADAALYLAPDDEIMS